MDSFVKFRTQQYELTRRPGAFQDRQRPPVPFKPQAFSGISAPAQSVQDDGHLEETNRINLIDLEGDEDGNPPSLPPRKISQTLQPSSARLEEYDVETPPSLPPRRQQSAQADIGSNLSVHENATASARSPSPLQGLASAWQTVSGGAVTAAKRVQTEAPKAFQGITAGTSKAFATAQSEVSKVFEAQRSGFQGFINGIAIPKPFAETGEDFSDLTKLCLGKSDICSRCASLPLKACFEEVPESEPYTTWTTALSRIVLHAKWCRMCQLLLSMLCRPEHDPLRSKEVQEHIEPEWLRGVPFQSWVQDQYISQDEYWPFGRSEHRHEGAMHIVGPVFEELSKVAGRASRIGFRVTARSVASGKGPTLTPKDFKRSQRQTFAQGYKQGRESHKQYPFSCVIAVTISSKGTPSPGLCWVDIIGCSNKPGSEQQVLSHFMLRAVRNSLSVHVSLEHSLSYGHVLHPEGIDMAMGRLWLTECETRHGKRCEEHGWTIGMQKPTFLRLIDVESLNVVVAENPTSCRYVALSYVWGGVETLKLRYANMKELSRPGGLREYLPLLPRTIVDAMEVVKELGERFLWVDSLCILQERTHESQKQIANMDSVYGNALLTTVAGQGDNAHSGLCGIRRRWFAPGQNYDYRRSVKQKTAKCQNDISVIAPYASNNDLRSSKWNKRAWTFQERLLSRRLLIFAQDEVTWHCRSTIAREDMPVEESGYPVPPLQWLALKPQYFGVGVDSHWKDGSFVMTRHGRTHHVRSGTFAEYAKMVAQYAVREMSYESDAINALAGLLRIFSLCFQAECIYGLPASLLDIALMWGPLEPLKKRDPSLKFPSWSWAAWKGRVAYDKQIRIKRDESGEMMETEGVRPLLRYFRFEKNTGSLVPLNGTARGLPMTDDEIPDEWEAHAPVNGCQSLVHTCKNPELFDLDPRIVPQIDDRHIFFWTSTSDNFELKSLQQGSRDVTATNLPLRMQIRTMQPAEQVGSVLLDSHGPLQLTRGLHTFVLFAEAQSWLIDDKPGEADYPYYVVMLVEVDPDTGISTRLGVGRITKVSWLHANLSLKLVCLG